MQSIGLLLIFLGSWSFFKPQGAMSLIYQNFYKKEFNNYSNSKLLGARILAALWVIVGVVIFLKG